MVASEAILSPLTTQSWRAETSEKGHPEILHTRPIGMNPTFSLSHMKMSFSIYAMARTDERSTSNESLPQSLPCKEEEDEVNLLNHCHGEKTKDEIQG